MSNRSGTVRSVGREKVGWDDKRLVHIGCVIEEGRRGEVEGREDGKVEGRGRTLTTYPCVIGAATPLKRLCSSLLSGSSGTICPRNRPETNH